MNPVCPPVLMSGYDWSPLVGIREDLYFPRSAGLAFGHFGRRRLRRNLRRTDRRRSLRRGSRTRRRGVLLRPPTFAFRRSRGFFRPRCRLRSPPFYRGEVLIHSEGFLPESNVHQSKSVFDFQVSVSMNGITAIGMKPRGIDVHLHLVHHIDVSLSGQTAGSKLIQGEILILSLHLVVLADFSVNSAESEEFGKLMVVKRDGVPVIACLVE